MLTQRFRGRQEGKQIRLAECGREGNNITDCKPAVCQRAGFIKSDCVNFAHLFQCFTGFDDYAVFCRLPNGRHNGGRSCKNQSAGTEYHQDSDPAHNVAGDKVGGDRD